MYHSFTKVATKVEILSINGLYPPHSIDNVQVSLQSNSKGGGTLWLAKEREFRTRSAAPFKYIRAVFLKSMRNGVSSGHRKVYLNYSHSEIGR